ncbi:membrane protein [Streptomyces asoensis]|uniref:Membrane protein n=2 Tax=Streptomyces TaxID=1883 RepID=A0ABQ3S2Y4_9ACTN|nr:membrane protein [Streptomyces asoensis]GHI62468.1 membrane protein [Streptomyces asoensis]
MGVRMYKAVRARLGALVCRVRAARGDAGMVTSEYAMGIVAAVGFAVLLYQVVTSDVVAAQLQDIVKRALSAGA